MVISIGFHSCVRLSEGSQNFIFDGGNWADSTDYKVMPPSHDCWHIYPMKISMNYSDIMYITIVNYIHIYIYNQIYIHTYIYIYT